MPESRVVVLRGAEEQAAPWEAALAGAGVTVLDAAEAVRSRELFEAAECVMVDGAPDNAVERLRQASRADAMVQAVVVASQVERPRIQRAVLLTPGLGEVWVVTPEQVGSGLLERAGEVTRKRRSYRTTRGRLAQDLSLLEPQGVRRTVISDAYLAALVEAAPDPILSVDEAGVVLSWNPGAERVLGFSRAEAIGKPLRELLVPVDGGSLPEPEDGAGAAPLRREIHFRRSNGDVGIGELIMVPVEAGGHRVRAVILHDLTEERRVQEALEAQAAELEAQAAEMEEQAAELEMTNDELHQRTLELEKVSSARARFYAAMSHELRTPINAILGYQDLILAGIDGPVPENVRPRLERAQRATRHLVELVNDVLDLAKIEAGRIELQVECVRFPVLIEELLDTVRSLADRYGSTVSVSGAGVHEIESDPRRARQILLNLLSNAIKFGEGNPIEVHWEALANGGVRVDVVDRGTGIAAEDLDRIFEEFIQLRVGAGDGTGLGLPISLRLARLLGGTLEVDSAPGRGSTFRLTLPAAVPRAEK